MFAVYFKLAGNKVRYKMNRIKELLAREGLKVKWIAEQIGCHPTEVSNWISGRRSPNLSRAIQLANLLGCTVEDLYPKINLIPGYKKTTKQQGETNGV